MGCNCKKTAEKAGKYSNDGSSGLEMVHGIESVFMFLLRVIVSILAISLIIIIFPFIIVWVIVGSITGKGIRINLKKLFKGKWRTKTQVTE